MKVVPFIADSAADAVAQIRAQLGPQAVVLNVRKLESNAISRLWQKPRIEVLACIPEAAAPEPSHDPVAELREEIASLKQQLPAAREINNAAQNTVPRGYFEEQKPESGQRGGTDYGGWRVGEMLESTGLLPRYAQKIVDRLKTVHGERPPESLAEQMQLARSFLRQSWPAPAAAPEPQAHVLIGAPGAGKTTLLCKWLVQSVLIEGRAARVWRLDGRTANTAESLSVYCDILKVPLDRSPSQPASDGEFLLIDLPGVNWTEANSVKQLGQQLATLPPAQVHLALNAAYEMPILLAQIRAFSALPMTDLVFTHMDEQMHWGNLWNFVFGTNYTVSCLSAGQNIPGDFFAASAEMILNRQFA